MKNTYIFSFVCLLFVGCVSRQTQTQTVNSKPVVVNQDRSLAYVLREELKRNFTIPSHCRKAMCEADVSFKLGRNGEFLTPAIVKSSGDRRFNDAALKSLRSVKPVTNVPPELIGQTVNIHFDSNRPG